LIERESDIAKTIGQLSIDIVKLTAPGGSMRREKMIIASANIFVKADVGRATQTASLCILVKDSADEERVIADVSPKQERFVLRRARKRD
jgi:hypothetical protein